MSTKILAWVGNLWIVAGTLYITVDVSTTLLCFIFGDLFYLAWSIRERMGAIGFISAFLFLVNMINLLRVLSG